MILSFQTKWPERMGGLAGQPNYFVEKILKGLPDNKANFYPAICDNCGWKGMSSLCDGGGQIADTGDYDDISCPKCGRVTINEWAGITLGEGGYYTQMNLRPKLHTIRHDPHNRWKPGRKIHFVINNRTKNRFQFAPAIEVKSVQKIEIKHLSITQYPVDLKPMIWIDTIPFYDPAMGLDKGMLALALNDGFPSVEAFFQYFNEAFSGKIIHFTDLKY